MTDSQTTPPAQPPATQAPTPPSVPATSPPVAPVAPVQPAEPEKPKTQTPTPTAAVTNNPPADQQPTIQLRTRYTYDVYRLNFPHIVMFQLHFIERNPNQAKNRAVMILAANVGDVTAYGLRIRDIDALE